MNRSLASLAVIAFFSVLLVGTSKAPPPASPDASAAPSAPPPLTSSTPPTAVTAVASIPGMVGWPRRVAKKLGASFAVPPGTKVGDDSELLVGLQLPSGAHASLQVDRDVPVSAASFVKGDFETATEGKEKVTIVLREPDAFIYRAHDGGLWAEAGKKVGKDIFRGSVGAIHDGKPDATRESDCLTLIAIVRSVGGAP